MDKTQPSRPTKIKNKPLPPVSNPVEADTENKYAKRTSLIGKPVIGRAIKVETVGLGNLKVETINGIDPNV